ncbi:unnamed protein product [Nesidiocoris tenuis]|uniref:Uncharacterized protein n=1 Tax=Nesidiocoris tenuis TaxID=355587 RepID=A0A6H5GV32_9HEMI|nr:unnamed protein product [Nesidiocoris tenuis]
MGDQVSSTPPTKVPLIITFRHRRFLANPTVMRDSRPSPIPLSFRTVFSLENSLYKIKPSAYIIYFHSLFSFEGETHGRKGDNQDDYYQCDQHYI